jgi:hypothetical protein
MQELSYALFASASVLMAMAVMAVGLRLYVRIAMIKSLGLDDYLMVAALVSYAGVYVNSSNVCRLST